MRRLASIALLPVLAGCLTSSPPPPVHSWTIEMPRVSIGRSPSAEGEQRGVVRVASATVRAPYDAANLVVLRADGSMAFDPYNRFAASPVALVRTAALDALRSSDAFRSVVAATSAARSDLTLELTVDRLALDCRVPEVRHALVSLTATLLKDREVFATVAGEATADAADGNYTRAFSAAFSEALAKALQSL